MAILTSRSRMPEETNTQMEQRANHTRQSIVSVVKRLGSTPMERGSTSDVNCPDIFALSDGRIGYIGTDLTDELRGQLPAGASIGAHERLVALPLRAVLDAIPDLMTDCQ